jgi:murein peptide amidase A
MERMGKNHGGYYGETIDIRAVRHDIEIAAHRHGWTAEVFGQQGEFSLLALHRPPLSIRTPILRPEASNSAEASMDRPEGRPHSALRIYLSAGIHGDEPAGPLAALRLLQENHWPENAELWFCPCLNPAGFALKRRANADGKDLNRDYRHLETAEVRAHIAWLERQPQFDLCLCLHEDWESHGFYVYELNPENRPSLAETMMARIADVCPIDPSPVIEGREAKGGIIRPHLDPQTRPQWAEAFYLMVNKTRYSCTLEAPSDFPLPTRVNALVTGVRAALNCSS